MAKNKKKKKVIHSSSRVLLCDTLPYETPIIFSNRGLFNYLESKHKASDKFVESIFKDNGDSIAFSFDICHKHTQPRTLSIMHPSVQNSVIELYKNYDRYMLYLCSRSKISLRYPCGVSESFTEKNINIVVEKTENKEQKEIPEIDEQTGAVASTYFSYMPYKLQYKFFDSYDFQKLERRFTKFSMLDISKCFQNIYTHSIAWAVKGKDFSKKVKSAYSFTTVLDKLMQKANYGETHGILIGPELSRIFAEIIFQTIDCNIERSLEEHHNLKFNREYVIRRYVDDFFVFYNEPSIFDTILSVMNKELSFYKLYIGESKTVHFERPFVTKETVAKNKISKIIDCFFENFLLKLKDWNDEKENKSKNQYQHRFKSRLWIQDFKVILHETKVDLKSVIPYSLKLLVKKITHNLSDIKKHIGTEKENKEDYVVDFLDCMLEFSFHLCSLDIRYNSSQSVCEMILLVCELCKGMTTKNKEGLSHNLSNKCFRFFDLFYEVGEKPHLEIFNVIITCFETIIAKFFDFRSIQRVLNLEKDIPQPEKDISKLDYFGITLYIYLLNKVGFMQEDNYAKDISDAIGNKLNGVRGGILKETEKCLLFLDFMSCPYIEEKDRNEKFNKLKTAGVIKECGNENFDFIKSKTWFTDWTSTKSIADKIHTKSLKTPYGDM